MIKQVKKLLVCGNMNYGDLAKLLGVSRNTITKRMKTNNFTTDEIKVMKERFNVTYDYFFANDVTI